MANETASTILVVDDNPAGRYATSRVLRSAGFVVLEAETGMQGLEMAGAADLVVLDVNLPDISGFEVCRRIRARAETARLPVVHLSATFVQDTDKVEGLDAGADGYLTHPVEPPVLVATVNAFLRARRAEDEMHRSEAKFKAIFNQALSGILLVSRDLVYLEANPAMCRLLGRPREQIIGRHNTSFVPPGFEHETLKIAGELEERGSWFGTFPLLRADGTHVQLEWSIARHTIPGVRLAIVHDVTERKAHEAERERLLAAERAAREEAERANQLKDEFLATLSHELRTPLNAIVGWAQILRRGTPSAADVAEGIDAIERNARSQAQLIGDLLDVSRITSGKLRLELVEMDLAATIDSALETMLPLASAKGIHLQRDLQADAGTILGDPDRMQQVIWNLVNNAVKFTPKEGLIQVTLAREASQITVRVRDNGQGIKSEFLPHIFERFRQENASSKRNQGGLGLGLAIVKHLVDMHGGTIAAHSDGEGKGATFTVQLPIAQVHQPIGRGTATPRAMPASPATETPPTLRGARVLVVEDNSDARAVLKHMLRESGAEVADAGDVTMALALLKTFNPHVLISDVGIPQRDGYDLIRTIRASGLSSEKLPAIALTAFARSEDRKQSIQAGFQVHLPKPVDARELIAAVWGLARRVLAPVQQPDEKPAK